MKEIRCYLAGKVKRWGTWDFNGHHADQCGEDCNSHECECTCHWVSERRGIKWELVDGIEGVVFVASDGARDSNHGYLTSEDHAWNCYDSHSVHRPGGKYPNPQAAFVELSQDVSFLLAIVDTPDAFGTIAEIAWCASRGTECHVVIIGDEHFESYQKPEGSMLDAYHFVVALPKVTAHFAQDTNEARKKVWSICGKKTHANYLRTPEWKHRREEALKRAGHRCQVCNTAKGLEVHHRTYENWGNEQPEDLTVLCGGCHGKFHDKP